MIDSNSDTNNNESDSENEKRKSKKPKYEQKFKNEWTKKPEYKMFSASNKGPKYAFCSSCQNDLKLSSGGVSDLNKHILSKKHLSMLKTVTNQSTLFDLPSVNNKTKRNSLVKITEIKLALFIVEHNLSFNAIEHLPSLIQAVCLDSEIATKVHCSRTKTTRIVNKVTSQVSFKNLKQILQNNKFSIIIDESTDLSFTKTLCIITRVCHELQIKDYFFQLIPLGSSADSVTLTNLIRNAFQEAEIKLQANLIGFASDGANTMMGKFHSVSALLKAEIPSLFLMKCICHSFHLCSSYACLKLPRTPEDLVRNIYNYLSNSPKRISEYQKFQNLLNIKPYKLLHPSQTRWLYDLGS